MHRYLILILLVVLGLVVAGWTVLKEKFIINSFVFRDLGLSLQNNKKAEILKDIETNDRQKLSEDIAELNNLVEALGLRIKYSADEFGIWSFDNINQRWSLYRLKFNGVVSSAPDNRFGLTYDSNFGKEVFCPLGALKGIWIQSTTQSWVYLQVLSLEFFDIDTPPLEDMTSYCFWQIYNNVPAIHKLCFENGKVVLKVWLEKQWIILKKINN